MAAVTEGSTSSSDKKNPSNQPTIAEEEDEETEQKPAGGDGKLGVQHLQAFGFNLAAEAERNPGKWDGSGGGAGGTELSKAIAAAKKGRSKNQNQTVVYGADPDDVDDTDFNDQDYDEPDYPVDDDSGEGGEGSEGSEEEGDDEEEEEIKETAGANYFDEYYEDADDMWEDEEDEEEEEEEDEEELERQRQEAFEAAMLAAEEERERLRDIRLTEIMKKKEILVERYLRAARIMINHRKKNIYLQDYLYHLALRKGVLRGDSQMHGASMDDESETLNKAMKRRLQKKNSTMASRFARFLRKTGHFYDDDHHESHHHHHHGHSHHANKHHHHHHHYNPYAHHHHGFKSKSRQNFNDHRSHVNMKKHHHHHHHNPVPNTLVRKNTKTCPEAEDGKECPLNRKTLAMVKTLRHRPKSLHSPKSAYSSGSKKSLSSSHRPRTLAELLEQKAAATLHRAMKSANEALDAFEKHRCRMAKKKQLLKISKLLERQYSGIPLLEQERNHLVSFVETSVKAQSLAKKRALRRQQKNKTQNKTGAVNLNHQWTKSLERIRELRLKKAKLEQDHRLVLLRKVKHWHIWEKRDVTAIEAVYEYVTDMASRMNMTKGETITFRHGLEQFQKQLYSLHETMLAQVIKMFRAQNVLAMTQRRAKDNTSVAAPVKGFSISDYERMIIENQESHNKLVERQAHLLVQYDKLKQYIKKVAESHLHKQRSWGALRTGRHDMKQLWELCLTERDNLLKKLKEIRQVRRVHRRLFMQISVLENKRLFKDFQQVDHNVKELRDHERNLHTQLHQTQSFLRILNVKLMDTTLRNAEAEKENAEKANREWLNFSKETIKKRIGPRAPNTIYNINIHSQKSQKEILENERERKTGTPIRPAIKRKLSLRKNQLPRI